MQSSAHKSHRFMSISTDEENQPPYDEESMSTVFFVHDGVKGEGVKKTGGQLLFCICFFGGCLSCMGILSFWVVILVLGDSNYEKLFFVERYQTCFPNIESYTNITFRARNDMLWISSRLFTNRTKDSLVIVVDDKDMCQERGNITRELQRNGFNVLLMSIRNHGISERSDSGYTTYGSKESRDILGAIDYVLETQRVSSAHRIGIYSENIGASATISAMLQGNFFQSAFVLNPICDASLYFREKLSPFQIWTMNIISSSKAAGFPPFPEEPYMVVENADSLRVYHKNLTIVYNSEGETGFDTVKHCYDLSSHLFNSSLETLNDVKSDDYVKNVVKFFKDTLTAWN